MSVIAAIASAALSDQAGLRLTDWVFLGQCYQSSADNVRECAITHRRTRRCFILHKKDKSPGRAIISPWAIPIVQRHNPELAGTLRTGQAFLEIQVKAVARDANRTVSHSRRREAEAKWRGLVNKALRIADTGKQRVGTGETPFEIVALANGAARVCPPLRYDGHVAAWYEGQNRRLESLLAAATPLVPATRVRTAKPKPAPVTTPVVPAPTVEIAPTRLPGIDDIVFEDIF